MTKYYTIPGYGGSGDDHWQTYFDEQLDGCQRINQHSWVKPVMSIWVKKIDQSIGKRHLSDTILITHSLGGIALLHWAQLYGKKIKGAVIVAPPDVDHPYENFGLATFAPMPKQKLPFPSIVVSSTNDPWMPPEMARTYADLWGSELVLLENAGHINGKSGYGTWEDGLKLVKSLG